MSIVPPDSTPFFPPLPNVSTRIIWDRWLDTDGRPVAPPTIEYVGGPWHSQAFQATLWAAPPKDADRWTTPTESNVGVWYAEVIVSNDPDLSGEIAIKVNSPRLAGGYVVVQVPAGTTPLHLGEALVVALPTGISPVVIQGPRGESAYEVAVRNGFTGTEQQWLDSLGGSGTGGDGSGTVGEPYILPGTASQYWRGDKSWQTLNKTAVGLPNVDNTSDAAKPISTATQSALNLKADLANPVFTGSVTVPDGSFTVASTAGLSTELRDRALQLRWDKTARTWPLRPALYPYGAMFISTSDSTAVAPAVANIQDGDFWLRHPSQGADMIRVNGVWTVVAGGGGTTPTEPTNPTPSTFTITATAGDGTITVTWTESAGATSYVAGRDGTDTTGSGAYQSPTIASTAPRTITFDKLINGTLYNVYVQDSFGTRKTASAMPQGSSVVTGPTGGPTGLTFQKIFADEFEGTTLDTTKWRPKRYEGTQDDPPFNVPTEGAAFRSTNVTVANGICTLTLKAESTSVNGQAYSYTSGCISSEGRFATKRGDYIEARVWVPGPDGSGTGLWPAFWTNTVAWVNGGVTQTWPPEIDIFEYFRIENADSNKPKANYHYGTPGARIQTGSKAYGPVGMDLRGNWHVYGCHRKDDGSLNFYVDGVHYPSADVAAGLPQTELDQFIIFNLSTYRNNENGSTATPAVGSQSRIDWVRVWRPTSADLGTAPTLNARVVGIGGSFSTKTTGAASVRIKAGTDTAVSQGVIYSSSATPNAQGWAKPNLTGLTPGTQYYYRVAMTNPEGTEFLDTGTVGSFRAAPTAATNFSFLFGSCTDASDPAVFTTMANRNDSMFLHLGDMWYDDPAGDDLASFRSHMQSKLTASNHQALLSKTPLAYCSSDHDFSMDNNGTGLTHPNAATNWNAAYREMIPSPTLPASGAYFTWTWGRVRFINCDMRTFKTAPSATDNSSKTALGATQKQWLKDTITNSTQKMIFIMSDTQWVGSAETGDDGWFGYTTERTELANFFAASGKKIIMLCGDAHMVAADNGSNAPGGISMFAAAPFYGNSSVKGGNFSAGSYPSGGIGGTSQYGRVSITDNGSTISARFDGYSADNVSRVNLTVSVTDSGTDPGSGTSGIAAQGTAAVTEVDSTTANGSIAANVPAGRAVGEVLIAQVATTTLSTGVTAPDSSWVLIPGTKDHESSAPISVQAYYRIVTGTEPATYTWTGVGTSRSSVIMQRFSGVNTTNPIDVSGSFASSGVTASLTVPGVTTVTAGALLISGAVANTATTSGLTVPSGMTQLGTTTGTGRRTSLASEARPSAGATGSRIWALSNTSITLQMVGYVVALRPASGSTPPASSTNLRSSAISTAVPAFPVGQSSFAVDSSKTTITGATPTNAWFENFLVYSGSMPVQMFPYNLKSLDQGLDISFSQSTVSARAVLSTFHQNVSLRCFESNPVSRKVTGFTDLGCTITWAVGSGSMQSHLVRGDAFITMSYSGLTPNIISQHAITSINGTAVGATGTFSGTRFKLTLNNGQTWKLYASSTLTFNLSNANTLTASSTFTGTIRAAIIPAVTNAETVLDGAAGAILTGGTVGLAASATHLTQTFNFTISGTGPPLVYTLPHHRPWLQTPSTSTVLTLNTLRGQMIAVSGATWTLSIPLLSIGWNNKKSIDSTKLQAVKDALTVDKSFVPAVGDPYFGGKQLAKSGRLALIADEVADTAARDQLIGNLRTVLNSYLSNSLGTKLRYDSAWGGIVSEAGLTSQEADFGNGMYNDHHFHWGYSIYAAAVVSKYDSTWLVNNKNKINDLVRDIMNPSSTDPYFTTFRHFDFYEGHSWAAGHFEFGDSRNQESTSEAVNAWYGVYLWGLISNQPQIEMLGRALMSQEVVTSQKYWQIKQSDTIYPSPFKENGVVGVLWANKVDYATFFGGQDEYIHGIQMIPTNPSTELLIPSDWIGENWTNKLLPGVFQRTFGVRSQLLTGGSGYVATYFKPDGQGVTDNMATSGGTGTGLKVNCNITGGQIVGAWIRFGEEGSGYSDGDVVNILGSGGTGATMKIFTEAEDGWKALLLSAYSHSNPTDAWSRTSALTAWDDGSSKTQHLYHIATQTGSTGGGGGGGSSAMPVGNLAGWTQVYTQDFNTDAALGQVGTVYGANMRGYDNVVDTSGNGTYSPDRVLSVSNSILNWWIHTETINGVSRPRVATPVPMGYGGQTYGRYSVRLRSDSIAGYKQAFLLWPASNSWNDGEIDFPETQVLGGQAYGTSLKKGTPATGTAVFDPTPPAWAPGNTQDWHIATMEWTPGSVKWFWDGVQIGQTSDSSAVPDIPMRWTLQVETATNGQVPTSTAQGNVQVDWIVAYSYTPGVPASSPRGLTAGFDGGL